jgi:hypothetical protein
MGSNDCFSLEIARRYQAHGAAFESGHQFTLTHDQVGTVPAGTFQETIVCPAVARINDICTAFIAVVLMSFSEDEIFVHFNKRWIPFWKTTADSQSESVPASKI